MKPRERHFDKGKLSAALRDCGIKDIGTIRVGKTDKLQICLAAGTVVSLATLELLARKFGTSEVKCHPNGMLNNSSIIITINDTDPERIKTLLE